MGEKVSTTSVSGQYYKWEIEVAMKAERNTHKIKISK